MNRKEPHGFPEYPNFPGKKLDLDSLLSEFEQENESPKPLTTTSASEWILKDRIVCEPEGSIDLTLAGIVTDFPQCESSSEDPSNTLNENEP